MRTNIFQFMKVWSVMLILKLNECIWRRYTCGNLCDCNFPAAFELVTTNVAVSHIKFHTNYVCELLCSYCLNIWINFYIRIIFAFGLLMQFSFYCIKFYQWFNIIVICINLQNLRHLYCSNGILNRWILEKYFWNL